MKGFSLNANISMILVIDVVLNIHWVCLSSCSFVYSEFFRRSARISLVEPTDGTESNEDLEEDVSNAGKQ